MYIPSVSGESRCHSLSVLHRARLCFHTMDPGTVDTKTAQPSLRCCSTHSLQRGGAFHNQVHYSCARILVLISHAEPRLSGHVQSQLASCSRIMNSPCIRLPVLPLQDASCWLVVWRKFCAHCHAAGQHHRGFKLACTAHGI